MSYRLRPRASVAQEVTRIMRKQLELAMAGLERVWDLESDEAVHEARRHIKKTRALLKLVAPVLRSGGATADRQLRTASRALAPIGDARAIVDTIDRLGRKYGARLPYETHASIRVGLVERAVRIDRAADFSRLLRTVARVLRSVRRRVASWNLTRSGQRAIAPGLERSCRRHGRSMARALAEPTTRHFHTWRQREKDLWLQVRLVNGRCANRLRDEERRLALLDDCLGECHNVALLEQVLTSEALAPRVDTARCVRLLRRYQFDLRRQASTLGARAIAGAPREFLRRVKRSWRSGTPAEGTSTQGALCARIA